ncbi:MAG: PQQ-like beta-propeller repeat protein [Nitrososphaerota archaeon]|jgi:hypothetical protein|uniref:hypothetical protein n=1 Tax=Candidatus Bathycorpusculum sp. TaxID=2994959 RepID=UPI002829C6CB|nr:PQQ-like beta-propeller repeat protein [Candidatus Termitimicrobium sp.]MCL2432010.1 PQQ-like beta-propeller repeat protein [Candidatus Termitimicrobium sp.]MDR0492907.1 PQQ-like beta-propeller repeat protein [Nitrososphaerota archaeon]
MSQSSHSRKISKKALTACIAALLIITVSASAFALPALARNPPVDVKTYAYVTASPNPAGVGEQVNLVFWLNLPPPSAAGNTGDRWSNFTVSVTRPDGTIDNLGTFVSDPVGSAWTSYTPTELGVYNVTFRFGEQVLQRDGYTGINGTNSQYVGDKFLASSATTSFTVQEKPQSRWDYSPLPISYWERPIDTMNSHWHVLGSNWLGQNLFGSNYLRFQSTGYAPNTPHVMWTKELSFGGIVGGNNIGNSPEINFYSGMAYQIKFPNPIILYGRLYYTIPLGDSPTGGGYGCIDLRTGETLWENPGTAPSFAQYYDYQTPNQHGIVSNGYLWVTGTITGRSLVNPNDRATVTEGVTMSTTTSTTAFSSSGWTAYDPLTGKMLYNLTDVPSGTRFYGNTGEICIMSLGGRPTSTGPYTTLAQWNNTKLPGYEADARITSWTPGTSNYNMSKAYDWNVTLSKQLPSTSAIIQVLPGDLVFGRSSTLQFTGETGSNVFGTPDPFTLWAVNLNESRGNIGEVMWLTNYTGSDDKTILIGQRDQQTHVFTMYDKETMQWTGYSLLTGKKLWGPTASEDSFNFYGGTTGLTAPYAVGYGRLYSTGYSGTLYCYDLATGELMFTYGNSLTDPKNSTRTPETVYGAYPYQVAAVGDDKVYLIPSEHSLEAPPYKGAEIRCVNATTGEEIWKILGMTNWQEVALADGYFVYLNFNDMRLTCIGPGPSATTVATSSAVISEGGSILITGSVTDLSPNTALKGTPAIADADQGPWMNYMVSKSIAKPDVTGVEVYLEAHDPNGNIIQIGTATSDSNGVFKKLWTPDVPGEYSITATFKGSQSYGPSSAGTAIGVTDAVQVSEPDYPQPIDNTMAIAGSAIAIIAVVIVIGLVILMTLKKRP